MFRENNLISKIGRIEEVISPAGITSKLNQPEKATAFSQHRIETALQEMQKPIGNIIGGIRGALSTVFLELPKKTAQKTLSTITKIATGAVALPANLARGTLDIALKVPLSAALGLASIIPEKTVGRISRIAENTREKALKALGETQKPDIIKT
ncbi:hypothetical protein GF366_01235 [Candidatus Peregrinibacteria bacterium]|nr:hypothetical protein [Candidatus Peregrinibacteria bacterium]